MHIKVSAPILIIKLFIQSGIITQIVLKEIRIMANKCGRILNHLINKRPKSSNISALEINEQVAVEDSI
jgi:hypothetical protein